MNEFDVNVLCDYTSGDGIRKISAEPCDEVCTSQIDVAVDGDVIRQVLFTGGCNGNTQGIAALVAGMKVSDAIARLEGIDCGGRGTSCPDQLARVLKQFVAK